MTYKCDTCNFFTNRRNNYSQHIKTAKHKLKSITDEVCPSPSLTVPHGPKNSKCDEVFSCEFCKLKYSHHGHLNRHLKICFKKHQSDIEKETLQKQLKEKEDENNILKKMLVSAGSVTETSSRTINYLIKNFNKAPILKKLNDYTILYDADEKDHFIRDIIFYHKTKDLTRYLSNFIIDNYKKEDPKDQAIWNSDTARLTYIIKDLINKKEQWLTDKKGVKTNEYIIDPMLQYIKDILKEHVESENKKILNEKIDNVIKIQQDLFIVIDILTCIDNKSLADDIIRYMAPHFYLKNKEEIKLIEQN